MKLLHILTFMICCIHIHILTFMICCIHICQGNLTDGSEDGPLTERNLTYHERLCESYDLYWNFNSSHIMFKAQVKTKGFVGFGISPNGGMVHADVIIGWVKDGQPYFADRHTKGLFMPLRDASQDWFLVNATEVDEHTTLTFIRKIETCDPKDLTISNDTVRVIYSYSTDDPEEEEVIDYHGPTNRGTKSVLLLNPPSSVQEKLPLPNDFVTLELLNDDHLLPNTDTSYFCKVFQLPDLGVKHHLIRYEPVIQRGHEILVHHILIYYCDLGINVSHTKKSYVCYEETPVELVHCQNTFISWEIGAQVFDYPPVVGHPLGRPEDPKVLIMETHYNNPQMEKDLVDSSGIRLYLTKQLRQFDAGVLEVGIVVDTNHIIPPQDANFLSSGHCHVNCLKQGLGNQEIRVFATCLHAHLLGRQSRIRHFRNGTELEPIITDNNYDFNYQENRKLRTEKMIKQGDSLLQECVYDSTERTVPTFGGLKTRDEMCLGYMLYYPRIELTRCLSRVQYNVPKEYQGQDMPSLVMTLNWTDPAVRQQFKYSVDKSDILNLCWFHDTNQTSYNVTSVPQYTNTYKEPNACYN